MCGACVSFEFFSFIYIFFHIVSDSHPAEGRQFKTKRGKCWANQSDVQTVKIIGP